jgi:hypothetical protein
MVLFCRWEKSTENDELLVVNASEQIKCTTKMIELGLVYTKEVENHV